MRYLLILLFLTFVLVLLGPFLTSDNLLEEFGGRGGGHGGGESGGDEMSGGNFIGPRYINKKNYEGGGRGRA